MDTKKEHGKIDWMITLVPLAIVIALCVLFFFAPEQSNAVLSQIRFFFGDTFGTYYLVIGLGIFIFSLYIAGSKYGNIVLGEQNEKPKYSFFAWGSMMFTCGLAADILFYSFSEWVLYATDPHLAEMGSIQDWAGVYPLFHWSFIPWGFYLVLAVAFGFMLHVRKRNRQKYSEACRPILGKYTDGWAGRIIDLLAVFALLAGTATTFSVATPLMATIISELFHVAVSRTVINIIILLITCAVYTYSLLHGFKGISKLANICIGQIPKFDKLIATIRSREISASIILQSQSQLKTIYKDAADTITGNCDCTLFLGGKEKSTLKEISEVLGKETIDLYNTSETRSNNNSYGLNYQKTGKELMSQDEIAVMDGAKCILQLRGVRPFLSNKYDITKHPKYRQLSDYDKRNAFDIEKYRQHKLVVKPDDTFDLYDMGEVEAD